MYWKVEQPEVIEFGTTLVRVYPKAQKIQLFRKIEDAPRGLSKGVTLDMDELTDSDKQSAKALAQRIIDLAK